MDGHDVQDFNRSELRMMFGMVLQDTWLFNGSIKDNIRYGKLDATDEEVMAAAKAAHVHRFVQTLPGGYNMELNEEAIQCFPGAETAAHHCQSYSGGPEDPDSRRGYQLCGYHGPRSGSRRLWII